MSRPAPAALPPAPPMAARRERPGRAWVAFALGSAGVVAYVLLLHVSWVRASGAPAFAALIAAQLLAFSALRRERRARTLVPAALTLALGLGFVWLFFVVAHLPASTTFEGLARAPDVEFQGAEVAGSAPEPLSDLTKAGPVLLVFFRGHW